jgi:uncharacterized protein (TIGR02266 family)
VASTSSLIYRNERRAARLQAELRVRYGDSALDHVGRVGNISENGLYIATNRVLGVGTRIRLALELPDEEVLHTAEVVWAIQVPDRLTEVLVHGMGVRFVDPDPTWLERFRRFKESLAVAAVSK